ncbi:MAG: FixH family protein [Ardenticatenaceae bacterium]|nr:FixH family protein [Ardenticatenaceae bacterium]
MFFKKATKLVLISFLLLLLSACGGRNSQQTNDSDIRIIVAVESTTVGETNLLITVTDKAGTPINDAAVSVKGDMSHAGMVPVLGEASSGENGVYKMPFEWTMGGDWVLTVDVTLPDGRSTSQQFNFTINS